MELMTVKEFAAAAGVSHQTIYKQLRNRLQPYVVEVAGTKKIKKCALLDVFGISDTEDVQPDATEVAQPMQPDATQNVQPMQPEYERIIAQNQQLIDMLQEELQRKDDYWKEQLQQAAPPEKESVTDVVSDQDTHDNDYSAAHPKQKKWWNRFVDAFLN